MTRGQHTIFNVAAGTAVAASTPIPMQDNNAGVITIKSAGASGVALSLYVSDRYDGEYTPLYDHEDTGPLEISVSSDRSYVLPSEAGYANFLKLVGNAAIDDITVTLKCI